MHDPWTIANDGRLSSQSPSPMAIAVVARGVANPDEVCKVGRADELNRGKGVLLPTGPGITHLEAERVMRTKVMLRHNVKSYGLTYVRIHLCFSPFSSNRFFSYYFENIQYTR